MITAHYVCENPSQRREAAVILWRTDIENAPRDGTVFLAPNPHPPLGGRADSGIWMNRYFETSGAFSVKAFSHWSEVNLPTITAPVVTLSSDPRLP